MSDLLGGSNAVEPWGWQLVARSAIGQVVRPSLFRGVVVSADVLSVLVVALALNTLASALG